MAKHHGGPQLQFTASSMAITFFLLSAVVHLAHASSLPHLHLHGRQDTTERPPQAPYVFNDTLKHVEQVVTSHLAAEKDAVQQILNRVGSPENATFDNTVLPYLQYENLAVAQLSPFFIYDASTKPDIATAQSNLQAVLTASTAETFTNSDFFALVDRLYQANLNGTSSLSEENRIVLGKLWNEFAENGLNIPAGAERDQYQAKKTRLAHIQTEFLGGLGKSSYVYFTADELDGLPADVIQGLKNGTGENAGKLQIDIATGRAFGEIFRSAVNETTRYLTFLAYERQAPENVPLVKESTKLRFEVAQLLNYSTWADYRTKDTLAGSRKVVDDFLTDLATNVAPLGQKNQDVINALKVKDERLVSPLGERDLAYRWDQRHYQTEERQTNNSVDFNQVKSYFPVNTTVPAVLEIYGEIYGLRYDRIDTASPEADELSPTGKGSDLVYHPDVMMYTVWDSQAYRDANPSTSSAFRGYLYLDLFRREGKTGPDGYEDMFIPGFFNNGQPNYPSVRIVLNFEKSSDENSKPSLLDYSYLGDHLMHELGHATHDLTSITTYYRTHGTQGVPTDLVELPSQMMENFARVPEVLKRISTHWSSFSPQAADAWRKEQGSNATNVPLPPAKMTDDLIAQVLKANSVGQGFDTLAQIAFASVDQDLYQQASLDEVQSTNVAALYNKVFREIVAIPDPSDLGQGYTWGNEVSNMDQFVSDEYAGSLYSYQWCLVYAEDVFYTAFASDPLNSEVGWRYRQQVLQPGGGKDVKGLLPTFLGREPNNEGYYRLLGIKGS